MHHLFNKKQHFCLLFCILLGSNPNSRLQVVSALNTVNISTQMYAYSPTNRTAKYYPKVYIGPSKTIGQLWIYEDKIDTSTTPPTTIKITEIPGWPENFEGPQKGEANTAKIIYRKHLFLKFLELLYKAVYFFLQCLNK